MAVQLKYDETIAGATLKCNKTGGYANLAAENSASNIIYWTVAGDTYKCTGYYYQSNGITYVQTTDGKYVAMNLSSTDDKARLQFAQASTTNTTVQTEQMVSVKETQAVVNDIIKNDFHITENNLFCARFAHHLTASEKRLVYDLQKRVEKRNNALSTADFLNNVQSAYPAGYGEWSPYLEKLMKAQGGTAGVGVAVSTIIIIVVVAVVVAAISYSLYRTYKTFSDESAQDVKFSDDLTKTLSEKLTAEEYKQLMEETQGIVTKAKIRQRFGGWTKAISYVAIAIGVFAAYKFLRNRLGEE